METYKNTAASATNEREPSIRKLMEIDGIARKTAEAIYEIGIHNFADLAQYLSQNTAEEVSEALKAHGVNRPPGLIDKNTWTRQAKAFSQREDTAPPPLEEETGPVKKSKDAPNSRDLHEHDSVFTVSFDIVSDEDGRQDLQTTVYDEKNAGEEQVFQGSDPAPWVNWMLERAGLPFAVQHIPEQPEVVIEPTPAETEVTIPPVPGDRVSLQRRAERDSPAFFQYLGQTGLTLIGPRTGKRYRFDGPGAVVAVDPKDQRALAGVTLLRQVRE